jgi:hypothetical protein
LELWWTERHWQDFCEYLGKSCHSFSPLIAPHSSPSITQGWYRRPINGRSNSGLGSTPGSWINKNVIIIIIITIKGGKYNRVYEQKEFCPNNCLSGC